VPADEDTMPTHLLRYAAFTRHPAGGNPAGIHVSDALPPGAEMQRIAADVGYSETAFLAPVADAGPGTYRVRYFSPAAEVPFCGHATIAAGVVLAERGPTGGGVFSLVTNDGVVTVETEAGRDGLHRATLTTVPASARPAPPGLVPAVLGALGWREGELDPSLSPAIGFAGAHHLVLAAAAAERLGDLDYDFERLRTVMLDAGLTTIQLVWRETADRFRARDPFPVGGVVEDPATGAAAAALGAYLRWRGDLLPPASFTVVQGVEMGRPSRIDVEVPDREGGIRVSGTAVPIER
jgi:PhzF family phenazine biosynthesis protein